MASIAEAKNHPFYTVLIANGMNPREAEKIVKDKLDAIEKENQALVEYSKEIKKIVIPDSMNKLQASKELKRQWDDEENVIEVIREFDNWNWKDVLVAVKKAAEQHFGWVQGKTIETFFGTKRPMEIEVIVDVKHGKKITETCFYGSLTASVWEDCQIDVEGEYIRATVKKRYADDVKKFFDLIQETLDTKSIYRGRSITVTEKEDPWGNVSLDFEIFELKTSDKIVLNEDIGRIIKSFIIDDLGEEGKRCYLFSGGYGNAKTETAMHIGAHGLAKGMSYFYCKDAGMFDVLLNQAKNYQPCIVFLEDVDEIGAGNQRDAAMNKILNTLDGVQTKGNNLTVIFTTNHENKINPALRRPGRIDIVVNFENPDKDSVAKIYEMYFREIPGGEELDYKALAAKTPDCAGAVVAEIAKRAVKLSRKKNLISNEMVLSASDSMKHHLKLMGEKAEESAHGDMTITVKNGKITSSQSVLANKN